MDEAEVNVCGGGGSENIVYEESVDQQDGE